MLGKITVLFFEVGCEPRPKRIPNTLKAMQELVGGYIESWELDDALTLICNEEGRVKGLPANAAMLSHRFGMQVICGNFFVCGFSGDQFISLHNSAEMFKSMDYVVQRFRAV